MSGALNNDTTVLKQGQFIANATGTHVHFALKLTNNVLVVCLDLFKRLKHLVIALVDIFDVAVVKFDLTIDLVLLVIELGNGLIDCINPVLSSTKRPTLNVLNFFAKSC